MIVDVITVSDRCSRGEAVDTAGPAVVQALQTKLDGEFRVTVVPDEKEQIRREVLRLSDEENVNLIITCGGTGFSERDNTPEAVQPLLHREAPGIVHAMLSESLRITPYGWLSRPVAGTRDGTLIITVPGSEKAATECVNVLLPGLKHALQLLNDPRSPHPAPKTAAVNTDAAATTSDKSKEQVARKPAVATRPRQSEYRMVPMKEALAAIEEKTPSPTTATANNSLQSLGCVLAEDVKSSINHPPFRASIKDGYAVVASDGTGVFPVVAGLVAGSDFASMKLLPGQVCRVNTGGPVPDGADAVVQVEDTEVVTAEGDAEMTIRILKSVKSGTDIRPIGIDLEAGGVAVSRGSVIGPAEIGLISSVGAPSFQVYRRPRIAVVSTGDELSPPGAELPPGKIYDSNRGMLLAALQEIPGCVPVDCGVAADDLEATRARLTAALSTADVVITTGGVSMGEVDCVKQVLLELGATIHFGRVNMKPGKPTTFATLGSGASSKLFFALPGNPVSAMVCFYVFVLPALRKLLGHAERNLPLVEAKVLNSVTLDRERPEYHRCYVRYSTEDHCFMAVSTGIQASHRLLSLSGANGLMVLPAATEQQSTIQQGQTVQVLMMKNL